MNALNSKDLSSDGMITSLKMVILAKIKIGASWPLAADDVTSLARLHSFLPNLRNHQWARVHSLILTQRVYSFSKLIHSAHLSKRRDTS